MSPDIAALTPLFNALNPLSFNKERPPASLIWVVGRINLYNAKVLRTSS